MSKKRCSIAACASLIISLAISSPAAADPKPPDPRYEVIASWKDNTGAVVYLRRGSWNGKNGWGFEKVTRYHNLNIAAVRLTTQFPESRNHISGHKYHFTTPVHHVRCTGWWIFRDCQIVETVDVTIGVDFRDVGNGSFGVVTAFCTGDPRCPDWVKGAANSR
ncbi:hypothetical protein [Cryptosporangium sp. NPDC048952]|uniref:hypothetical protein n=1 Tax=Cryptosporangium sp. NPDC048952 TaxID=3363961 RepID=UPI00371C8AD0